MPSPARPWHDAAEAHGARVTLLTWNLLADALAEVGGFVLAPPASLAWQHAERPGRGARILVELRAAIDGPASPDVICMQEVDHFADTLQPALGAWGYDGCFEPKRPGSDGLCLFVRRSRWSLADLERLRYHDGAGKPHGQLALIAGLKGVDGSPDLRVATTHLKAKAVPESQAQRAVQCTQLRARLEHLQAQEALPLLLAGDFNAEPDSPEIQSLQGGELELKSADPAPCGQRPAWTTWKVRAGGEVRRVIDYVFYGGGLTWLGGLGLPGLDDLPVTGLPCWEYPSDHLHLCHAFGFPAPDA